MKAVILAAGLGTRLGGIPKPLLKVGGQEIILRTMKLLSPYVSEFVIVASVYTDAINEFLKDKGYRYVVVKNDKPERGNGYSLLMAKEYVNGKFILVMGDHIYSMEFVEKALKGEGLIGDRNPLYVDIDEATKVKVENRRVKDAGKSLQLFDCVDTGFFILDPNIFKIIEKIKKNEIQLSEVVKEAKLPVSFVDGEFWMDIDTKEDAKKANNALVKAAIKSSGDGFISRYLNRKISTALSAKLVNHLSPAQMTVVSFFVGVVSSLLLLYSISLAAVLYQISSILDGCDGEIARASLRTSKIGGYVDSILDRFVDFLFLFILAVLYPETMYIALFAIFGSVMVSYSTEKYKAEFGKSIYDRIAVMRYLPGKRDERIFIIMLLLLVGLIYWLFVMIAAITILRVVLTLLIVMHEHKNERI